MISENPDGSFPMDGLHSPQTSVDPVNPMRIGDDYLDLRGGKIEPSDVPMMIKIGPGIPKEIATSGSHLVDGEGDRPNSMEQRRDGVTPFPSQDYAAFGNSLENCPMDFRSSFCSEVGGSSTKVDEKKVPQTLLDKGEDLLRSEVVKGATEEVRNTTPKTSVQLRHTSDLCDSNSKSPFTGGTASVIGDREGVCRGELVSSGVEVAGNRITEDYKEHKASKSEDVKHRGDEKSLDMHREEWPSSCVILEETPIEHSAVKSSNTLERKSRKEDMRARVIGKSLDIHREELPSSGVEIEGVPIAEEHSVAKSSNSLEHKSRKEDMRARVIGKSLDIHREELPSSGVVIEGMPVAEEHSVAKSSNTFEPKSRREDMFKKSLDMYRKELANRGVEANETSVAEELSGALEHKRVWEDMMSRGKEKSLAASSQESESSQAIPLCLSAGRGSRRLDGRDHSGVPRTLGSGHSDLTRTLGRGHRHAHRTLAYVERSQSPPTTTTQSSRHSTYPWNNEGEKIMGPECGEPPGGASVNHGRRCSTGTTGLEQNMSMTGVFHGMNLEDPPVDSTNPDLYGKAKSGFSNVDSCDSARRREKDYAENCADHTGFAGIDALESTSTRGVVMDRSVDLPQGKLPSSNWPVDADSNDSQEANDEIKFSTTSQELHELSSSKYVPLVPPVKDSRNEKYEERSILSCGWTRTHPERQLHNQRAALKPESPHVSQVHSLSKESDFFIEKVYDGKRDSAASAQKTCRSSRGGRVKQATARGQDWDVEIAQSETGQPCKVVTKSSPVVGVPKSFNRAVPEQEGKKSFNRGMAEQEGKAPSKDGLYPAMREARVSQRNTYDHNEGAYSSRVPRTSSPLSLPTSYSQTAAGTHMNTTSSPVVAKAWEEGRDWSDDEYDVPDSWEDADLRIDKMKSHKPMSAPPKTTWWNEERGSGEYDNPSNAEAIYFRPKHNDAKIFENHLNPVMLVFIGKLSLGTLR